MRTATMTEGSGEENANQKKKDPAYLIFVMGESLNGRTPTKQARVLRKD